MSIGTSTKRIYISLRFSTGGCRYARPKTLQNETQQSAITGKIKIKYVMQMPKFWLPFLFGWISFFSRFRDVIRKRWKSFISVGTKSTQINVPRNDNFLLVVGGGRERKCLRLLMIHVLEFLNFNDAELILPFLSLPRWLKRGCLPTFFYIIIPAFRGVSMESFRSFRKILRSVFSIPSTLPSARNYSPFPTEIFNYTSPRKWQQNILKNLFDPPLHCQKNHLLRALL